MKDIQLRKMFRTKKTIKVFQIDNGDEQSVEKNSNAASWQKVLCNAILWLYQNQYGQLMLCLRTKKGQTVIQNQYLQEDIEKKILLCKDTCRGYQLEVLSPEGSMNARIGILFETRIEAFEFSTVLKQFCEQTI
ncbi:hypothetical protein ABPG74_014099 [Tetrahymena malaccensis]